jgi:hypothetical protein
MNENPALITPHAFASRLPKSGQILYQAPSQRRYIIAALITGSIFMFMGFGTVWIRETELTVQPWWVMLANGVVVIFCTGAGIWVFAGTLGICKRITAFPAAKARDGLRVIVEGSDYWLPWRTRTVEAALEDVSILRSMADAQSDVRRKFTPRLPDSEVSSFIRPFLKLGRGFGAFAKEVQNACSRQAHPSLLIRQGKGTETVKFKLDIRGQAFGGAKGKSLLRFALFRGEV